MTGTVPEGQPPPVDLTARVFRALYDQFDLHSSDGTHIAVPKGTPLFAGTKPGPRPISRLPQPALADLARPAPRY